jgi:hypothetical protein
MALSIIGKLKTNETFFFPLRKEWVQYIDDQELLEKLDLIASEKDEEIGIEFYKRYGIHPSENKAIPDASEKREKVDKAYLEQLKAVSQKTGLSVGEIESIVISDNSLMEKVEEIIVNAAETVELESVEKKIESAKIAQESIVNSRKRRREFSKETADLITPYLDELNKLYQERIDTFDNYNRELIRLFLNSPRRTKKASAEFTREDIEALHPSMLVRLYNDYVYVDISQWTEPPKTSEKEPEKPEDEEAEKNE